MFRGFENIGDEYGMVMAVLGGDDAGGGVTWAPQVIEEASAHGLILGDNGVLYDSKKNQNLPEGVQPMQTLAPEEVEKLIEPTASDVAEKFVARYWDMVAMSDKQPAKVIGNDAMIKDRPGFDVEFLSRHSISADAYTTDNHEILMVINGHWRVSWDGSETTIAPGDTCAIPPGVARSIAPSMTGDAALYRVRNTDDPAGPTHWA